MRLSIVVITFNSQASIRACLDSIMRQDARDIEIVVVDNDSRDQTREIIKTHFPGVNLIENPKNFGASKARNQGIEGSSGDWVLALDNDVVLGDGFLAEFERIRKGFSEDVGMIQPNVLSADGKTVYSQGIHLSACRRFHDLNQGKPKDGPGLAGKKIIGPCSAAAFYRRAMLNAIREKTGYFDERFFFLVEDVDLAWRASRAGWQAQFCPDMTCCHAGNSSDTGGKFRQYLCFRNRHWMIQKNEDLLGKIRVYALFLPYELVRCFYLAVSNKYFWTRP
ncbi:MAG: glycosyltransferase family 2 protein [Candidatus Omnitrophota bacterium]